MGAFIYRVGRWAAVPVLSLALVGSAMAGTGTTTGTSTTSTTQTSTSTTASTTTTTSTPTTTSTSTTTTPVTITPTSPPPSRRKHRGGHKSSPAPTCQAAKRTSHTAGRTSDAKRSCPARHRNKATKRKPRKPPHHHKAVKRAPTQSQPTHQTTGNLSTLPLLLNPGTSKFFIDSFQIPPFLLPIYQAAGIEYDVPWSVLAAINWIETDYGRNLDVSSAGAVGWMQFLPSTWREWGVDATGSGFADPYNPTDAIFSAARYLQAAGAAKNLAGAIFAYNHASWYVHSVLLRARLIQSIPASLLGALTQMVQGRFPVAAPSRYRDSGRGYSEIESTPGAAVVAVNDGTVVRIGRTRALGRYVELRDAAGNLYTYAHLGRLARAYAVPKLDTTTSQQLDRQLALPSSHPRQPASAGTQPGARAGRASGAGSRTTTAPAVDRRLRQFSAPPSPTPAPSPTAPPVKLRLFAHPWRPASFAAGGDRQVATGPLSDYFADALHLKAGQYVLAPLHAGAVVVAGTILGHLAVRSSARLRFSIRPAGRLVPAIDPKPILDGWKLLAASAVFRRAWSNPVFGPGASNPSVGQVLLMTKQQLASRVLSNHRIHIYACGRRDIQAGLIDRRVLAVIAYLAGSGLYPTVSGLECGHSATGATGVDAAGATGESVDIAAINGTPILGHQGRGSITDLTIRRLLSLQGAYRPAAIVSLMRFPGQSDTISLPDHADRIQVSYAPIGRRGSATAALSAKQWRLLIGHLGRLAEPAVPIGRSRYAFAVGRREA